MDDQLTSMFCSPREVMVCSPSHEFMGNDHDESKLFQTFISVIFEKETLKSRGNSHQRVAITKKNINFFSVN